MKKLSKASRYQKLTVSKKSEKADPDARVKMVQQMWPVAAEFWVYQKSKLSAIESLSQQLIFTFQGMLMQSWRLPWFHISQKCRIFLWSTPAKKTELTSLPEVFAFVHWKAYMQESNAIIDLPAFLDMSTRATTVSEWWWKQAFQRLVFHQQTTNLASWIR